MIIYHFEIYKTPLPQDVLDGVPYDTIKQLRTSLDGSQIIVPNTQGRGYTYEQILNIIQGDDWRKVLN